MANNNSSKSNSNNGNNTGNTIGLILIAAGFWYVSNNPGVLQSFTSAKPALASSAATKAYAQSQVQTSSDPIFKDIKENLSKIGSNSDSTKSNSRYSSVYGGETSVTEPSVGKGGAL